MEPGGMENHTIYGAAVKDEEIPIPGRIVALADVFDALTTARPYKKTWSAASAFREIRGDSGTQFDPRLVDCLMDAADEIIDCKEAG